MEHWRRRRILLILLVEKPPAGDLGHHGPVLDGRAGLPQRLDSSNNYRPDSVEKSASHVTHAGKQSQSSGELMPNHHFAHTIEYFLHPRGTP